MLHRNSALLGILAAAAVASCTGQNDIDRTQPNRMPKSMFTGTWYLRTTVTGVPGTSAASFIGQTGTLEKVRWEVQEDHLVAYRAYEEVPGTDSGGKNTQEPADYRENPIASFRILSHFDVKRDYNAATGEQTNVIGENTSDRPWYERDYIRVDWAESEIDAQQFSGATGQVPYRASYYVQPHETGPDAMRVVGSDGSAIDFDRLETIQGKQPAEWSGAVSYFDMVGRFLLEPEKVAYPMGDGTTQNIPLCYFIRYGGRNHQTTTCGAAEVKVRTAFLRADARNFQPRPLDDRELAKFGFFRTERFTWDRRYGFTEAGRIYLANIHNIWDKAYQTNEDGTFQVGADGKFVEIPVDQRTPKPIVYHLSDNFPCELIGTAQQIAGSWNRAVRRSVAVSKGLLDNTTGDTGAELESVPLSSVPNMFTVDLNGWSQKTPGDDYSCGNLQRDESKVTARIGDLRYNFMAWVHDRQITGPLGFGPSSSDPETGEIVAGMAYVYGAAVDEYATRSLEIIRTLNDDLSIDDNVSGKDVADYIAEHSVVADPRLIPAEAANLAGTQIFDSFLTDAMRSKIEAIKLNGFEPAVFGARQSRIDALAGTPLADRLLDEEIIRGMAPTILQGQAIGAGDDISADIRQKLNPLAWAGPEARAFDDLRQERASAQCLWLAEFSDDSIQGLALEVWNKYHRTGEAGEYDAMWQHLRELIFRGVMEHEVGHTLGLRHNFAGSYDSINYFDKYWELRRQPDSEGNGGLIERDPTDQNVGLNLGETYAQVHQNQAQIEGRMREYQYSSIMDYGARFNSDVHGIGKYDEAAIMFGYTGWVEVFGNPPDSGRRVMHDRYSDCKARFESIPNLAYPPVLEMWHYSSVWNLLGRTEGLRTRRFRPWADIRTEQSSALASCKEQLDGGSTVRDFVDADMTRDVEVPFMFCSDELVNATVSCHRWDEGADPREIVENVDNSYRNYYFFNNYKRGRFGFDAYSVYQRIAGRYFSYLPNIYQHWLFRVAVYGVDDVTLANYWTMGTYSGFNTLMDTIAKPAYGTYCSDGTSWKRSSEAVTEPAADSECMVIGSGDGRRRYSKYDFDSGYYYQNQLLEVGHFWEHLAALEALTASSGTFVGVETGTDFTSYLVPYYIAFEDELTQFFEGSAVEDYGAYAPRVVENRVALMPPATLQLTNGMKIDPSTGQSLPTFVQGLPIDLENNFTTRFYTMVQGMSEFRSLYSLRFADRAQVFRVGSGQEVTPGPGKEIFSCHDPIGGHIYGTVRDPSALPAQVGAAEKMIDRCRTQAQAYSDLAATSPNSSAAIRARGDLNQTIEWLNFMRSLYDVFGKNI